MPLVPTARPRDPASPRFLFLDLETSQLDPAITGACVLELAYIACDADLNILAEHSTIVAPSPSATYSEWARANLHPALTAPLAPQDPRPCWTATARRLARILTTWGAAPYRLAGWSPHFDLGWLRRSTDLAPLLSHRVWDCSTLRDMDSLWSPSPLSSSPERPHRALDDCRSALDFARRWRAHHYGQP